MFISPTVEVPYRANGQALRREFNVGKSMVLVVEDHEDTRFLLREILEMKGCGVVEACDGLEAVHLAESVHPDLILMDGSLPLFDGLSATRRIRENARLREVPIIAVSGHAEPAFQSAALAAGCTDYLAKPFACEQLEKLIDQYLRNLPTAASDYPGTENDFYANATTHATR